MQEEEDLARSESAALELRAGSQTVVSGSVLNDADTDVFSTNLEPASKFEAAAKKIRVQLEGQDKEIAKEWGALKMVVGMEIIKRKLKASQLVAEWDKKGKGVISKVEFRQGVKDSLMIKADMKALDALFDSFDEDGGGTLDAMELRDALNQVKHGTEQLKLKEASMREEQSAVKARMERLQRTATSTRSANAALMAGGSEAEELEKVAMQLQGELAAEEEAARKVEEEIKAAAEAARLEQEQRAEEQRKVAEAEAAAKALADEKRAKEDAAQLESSESLTTRIAEVKAVIKELEASSAAPTLEQQLGAVLVKKNLTPKDIVAEWDRKHTGAVGKIEFRQGVRSLGIKAENKDIDALFSSLDDDGGGTLDAAELKDALKVVQVASAIAMEEAEVRAARQVRLSAFVGKIEFSLKLTTTAEAAIATHATARDKGVESEANIAASYSMAADLKRTAIKAQLELIEQQRLVEKADEEANARAEQRRQVRADAEAAEKAKVAEKKRLADEEERKRKAERLARSAAAREKATFGATTHTFENAEDEALKDVSSSVAIKLASSLAATAKDKDGAPAPASSVGAPASVQVPAPTHKAAPTMEELRAAFDAFDKDGSGDLDADELRHVIKNLGLVASDVEVDEMVRQADTDGNGSIDFDEFVELMTKGHT